MSLTIAEALESSEVPVFRVPYTGSAPAYITYQLLGQTGQIYAEGREAATGVSYAVNIWSPGYSAVLMLNTKALLEAAGYIVTVDMENYDHDMDIHQSTLVASIEGSVYG